MHTLKQKVSHPLLQHRLISKILQGWRTVLGAAKETLSSAWKWSCKQGPCVVVQQSLWSHSLHINSCVLWPKPGDSSGHALGPVTSHFLQGQTDGCGWAAGTCPTCPLLLSSWHSQLSALEQLSFNPSPARSSLLHLRWVNVVLVFVFACPQPCP